MGFTNGTMVNTPNGPKAIEAVQTGDVVRVASLVGGGGGLVWTNGTVQMNAGTADMRSRAPAIFIAFGDSQIVCSAGQPFLMPDGRMKPAERLDPGVDRLVEPDGTHVTIGAIQLGEPQHGEHAIAIAGDYAGTPSGHLIEAGGIVCGDYVLQLHPDPNPEHDPLPQRQRDEHPDGGY